MDGVDDPADLSKRKRRGRQQGSSIRGADGVAQLSGERWPGRVTVLAMQICAAQAARRAGEHKRANQAGAVADPHRQMRHPLTVQIAHQMWISDEVIGQYHQIGVISIPESVWLAAVLDHGT